MKRSFLCVLMVAALLLAACDNGGLPDPYQQNWCYVYDFKLPIEYVNLINGEWVEGVGIVTDADGEIVANFVHDGPYFQPDVVGIQIARGEGVSGDIDVDAIGDVFSVPVSINETIPGIAPDPLPLKLFGPDSPDEVGVAVNATIVSSQEIVLEYLIVAGDGATPYGSNPCDPSTPTQTATPEPTTEASPEPSLTVEPGCDGHDDTLTVNATTGAWETTTFETSPSCVYAVEVSGKYEFGSGDYDEADAFYYSEIACDAAEYDADNCMVWDFTTGCWGIPNESGTSQARGEWVDGVGCATKYVSAGVTSKDELYMQTTANNAAGRAWRHILVDGSLDPGQGASYVYLVPLGCGSTITVSGDVDWDGIYERSDDSGTFCTGLRFEIRASFRQASGHPAPNPRGTGLIRNAAVYWDGAAVSTWTVPAEWFERDNLIFESVPDFPTSSGWNSPPLPRDHDGDYVRTFEGNGSTWRFKIDDDSYGDNAGTLSVRVYAIGLEATPTPSETSIPTFTYTPSETYTPSPTPTRTPIGWEGGTLTATRTATRTPIIVATWTARPSNTPLPSFTPLPTLIPTLPPPTLPATPTVITATPVTHTPEFSYTPLPTAVFTPFGTPGGTPWGTPVLWGTQWGSPVWTPIGPVTDLPPLITAEYGPIQGFLSTAAAQVNSLPNDISGYVPQVDATSFFGYLKWTISCVSVQELVGQTLSTPVCHAMLGFALNIFLSSVMLTIFIIRILIKFVMWIVGLILKLIPTMG